MSIVHCRSVNIGGLSECETLQECAHHVGHREYRVCLTDAIVHKEGDFCFVKTRRLGDVLESVKKEKCRKRAPKP